MSRIAYKVITNDKVEYSVEERHSAAGTPEAEHGPKKSSVNRGLFIAACFFVGAAFVVMTASSRSALGGTFLFVGVLFAFLYAAREVRSITVHRR